MATTRAPWWTELPEHLFRQLFPRGQADVDQWQAEWEELQRSGYPVKCTDPETLLQLAQIARQ